IEAIKSLIKFFATKEDAKWKKESFGNFLKSNFEEYYPKHLDEDVKIALAEKDVNRKKKRKEELLTQVQDWAKANKEGEAKKHFEEVAQDVIALLREIEVKLGTKSIV
ncbi:MAG: hypothetical protein HYZ54_08160, partial [Ignavibacteriae bacterium]|nr:hypothetical protein [Ignavibacteriota bacterium]